VNRSSVHSERGAARQGKTAPAAWTRPWPGATLVGRRFDMPYKLWYFPIRGRAEQIRLLFHALDVPFEDIKVNRDTFMELKQRGVSMLSFGSLPLLEDDDFRLVQGPVILGYVARKHGAAPTDPRLSARADSIALGAEDLRVKYFQLFGEGAEEKQKNFVSGELESRWLPSFEGLLEQNGDSGYFVGDSLSHADIAVWDVFDALKTHVKGVSLDGFPRLQAFHDQVRARPSLAAYLESPSRPK
jgi:prostaglandin-H2 D-isomerase / glutathione transferase